MDNQDGAVQPRPRIVDTSGMDFGPPARKRRRRNARSHDGTNTQFVCSKRTAELSAMEGVHALRELADRMRRSGPLRPALQKIMYDAEAEAARLRSLLDQVYEDD